MIFSQKSRLSCDRTGKDNSHNERSLIFLFTKNEKRPLAHIWSGGQSKRYAKCFVGNKVCHFFTNFLLKSRQDW